MKMLNRIYLNLLRGKQREALFHLRNLSDRQLLDCGISPYLVSKGLKGWPWRIENTTSECSTHENINEGARQDIAKPQSHSTANTAPSDWRRGTAVNSVQEVHSDIKHKDSVKAA